MLSRLMTRREQLVLLCIALAILLGAVSLFVFHRSEAEPVAPVPVEAISPPDSEPSALEEPEIVVSVQGAVRDPGVYSVSPSKRVNDLIQVAGGLSADADTRAINLAARLVDGTTLTIPRRSDLVTEATARSLTLANPSAYRIEIAGEPHRDGALGSAAAASGGEADFGGGRIDLNRASQAELESLPGIGPTYAQRIIAYREATPFRDVSELMNINGIGPKRYDDLHDRVVVR